MLEADLFMDWMAGRPWVPEALSFEEFRSLSWDTGG